MLFGNPSFFSFFHPIVQVIDSFSIVGGAGNPPVMRTAKDLARDLARDLTRDNVMRAATASRLVYPAHIHDICLAKTHRCQKHIEDPMTCTFVRVWNQAHDTASLLVAFRGSTEMRHICGYVNTATRMADARLCEARVGVHRGVFEMFNSIEGKLTAELARRGVPPKEISFCGHSLGGALAMVAAAYYSNLLPSADVSCYTFAAPKVGDAAFQEHLVTHMRELVHVVNDIDLVPRFPFMSTFLVDNVGQKYTFNGGNHPLHGHRLLTYLHYLPASLDV